MGEQARTTEASPKSSSSFPASPVLCLAVKKRQSPAVQPRCFGQRLGTQPPGASAALRDRGLSTSGAARPKEVDVGASDPSSPQHEHQKVL